jgi:hypothetical protein
LSRILGLFLPLRRRSWLVILGDELLSYEDDDESEREGKQQPSL